MGDRIGVQLAVREIFLGLTDHPGQLSLVIPPWAGAISTGEVRQIWLVADNTM